MNHRVPHKWVFLALAALVMFAFHIAVLLTAVNVRGWWWPVIAGIALLMVVKAVVVIVHVRKIKRAKAALVEIRSQNQFEATCSTSLAHGSRDSRQGK